MSQLITFLDAYEEAQSVLPYNNTNDPVEFAKLLNRAAVRLISKVSMPNLILRTTATVVTDAISEGAIIIDARVYESLLSVKKDCYVYDIMPASSLFLDSKIGVSAIIDDGFLDPATPYNRYYSAPSDLRLKVGDEVQILVKKAYVKVSDDADILPFDSVGAIKNAMIAVFYEDQGDAATAANYWAVAAQEAVSSAQEYRGSAYPVMTFSDPLFDSVTKSVY